MDKIRIMFTSDDFKTRQWGAELMKHNCQIIPAEEVNRYLIEVLLSSFFKGQKIHVFIFRYLNDKKVLRKSIKLFLRDLVIIILCKVLKIRIIWLLHNIDRETKQYYPFLSRLRRKYVARAAGKILVTDPNFIQLAIQEGIDKKKIDWTCFGITQRGEPDQRNIALREQIISFRQSVLNMGYKNIALGLCVSQGAKKKVHYLFADLITGRSKKRKDSCVILVMIGNYPEGIEFETARKKAIDSPFIFLLDEPFPVNEEFIADHVDFFYRSMTDLSMAYSVYVACQFKKPVITHDIGALPMVVKKENIGYVIGKEEKDIPGFILHSLESWHPLGTEKFLAKRNWQTGSDKLIDAITALNNSCNSVSQKASSQF